MAAVVLANGKRPKAVLNSNTSRPVVVVVVVVVRQKLLKESGSNFALGLERRTMDGDVAAAVFTWVLLKL